MKNTFKDVRDSINSSSVSFEDLVSFVGYENLNIRASAMIRLKQLYGDRSEVIRLLGELALSPDNHQKPIMGVVTPAHLAMKLLSEIQLPMAQEMFDNLYKNWPVDHHDKEDLDQFLEGGY